MRETPWSRLSISSSANTSTETYKSDSKNIEIFGEKNVTSTCCDNGTADNDFLCLESNKYEAQHENENSSRSEVNYHSPIVGTITTPTIPKFINERKSSILHVLQARKLRIRQSGGQYLSYSPCQNMAKLNKNKKKNTNNDSDEPSDGVKLSALEGESAEIAVSKNVLSEVNEGTVPATNNDKNHRNAYYSSTGEMEINNSPSRPKTPAMSLLSIFSPRPFHPTLTRQVSEFFQRSCDGDPLCFTFKPPPPCTLSISAIAALYPPFLKGTIIPGNLPVIENIPVREGMIQRTGSLDSTEDEHFIRIPVDNILLAREYPEGGLTLTSLEDVSSSQSDLYPDTDPNNVVQSPSPVPSVIILGTEANYCSQKTSESRCNALPNKILKTLAGKYEAEEAAYLMSENDSSILAWRRVEVEEELLRSPIAPKSTPQSTKKVYKLTNLLDPELEEIIELKNVSFLIQQIEGKEVTKNSKQSIALL